MAQPILDRLERVVIGGGGGGVSSGSGSVSSGGGSVSSSGGSGSGSGGSTGTGTNRHGHILTYHGLSTAGRRTRTRYHHVDVNRRPITKTHKTHLHVASDGASARASSVHNAVLVNGCFAWHIIMYVPIKIEPTNIHSIIV